MINTFREAGLSHAIIHITGESDVGKTSMALECGADPEEIVFIDSDIKGATKVSQLVAAGFTFGMYKDVVNDTRGMLELDKHQYYLGVIEEIKALQQESRRVIIFDTFEPFEKTCQPMVHSDPSKFRKFYSPKGQIKGSEIWLASFDYEGEIVGELSSLCELLILVTHVKNYNIGGKRVAGKSVADCKRPVVQKSLARIWLKHNPTSGVPIGLVMKRLGKTTSVKGKGIRTVNVLPRKITPADGEESLWDTIKRYWAEPIGNRAPEPHETPDMFELGILDGTLTEDQRMVLKLATIAERESSEIELLEIKGRKEEAREHMDKTGDILQVAEQMGVTVPEALELLK